MRQDYLRPDVHRDTRGAELKQNDWDRFVELITGADETTSGKARSPQAMKLLYHSLRGYEFSDVSSAVLKFVNTCKFNVNIKPADVHEALRGSLSDRSAVAWQFFKQMVARYGYYDSVQFPDAGFHYAITQLGGWESVSKSYMELTDKELEFREKGWRELYEIGYERASWDGEEGKVAVPKYLPGFHERNNREGGFLAHLPPVVELQTGKRRVMSLEAGHSKTLGLPKMKKLGGAEGESGDDGIKGGGNQPSGGHGDADNAL